MCQSYVNRNLFCIFLLFICSVQVPRAFAEESTQSNTKHQPERIRRNAFSHRFNSSEKFVLQTKEVSTKNSTKFSYRPRFAVPRDTELKFNPDQYMCQDHQFNAECRNKTELYREIVTREFHRILNMYGDQYPEDGKKILNSGKGSNDTQKAADKSLCLSQLKVRILRRKDLSNTIAAERKLQDILAKKKLFPSDQSFKSCAVISSAGSLSSSKLGKFIDAHDLVMRFNHAPTKGFEEDVGTKTTIRIINSQVISKPEFDFLNNPLFRNITIAAWDPGRYNGLLSDWIAAPDFDMFSNFKQFMAEQPDANAHIIDPRSLWKLWETLQSHFSQHIRQNPPSSGFVGIALLVPHCETIDVIEYIPSTRLTGRCHYYETQHNAMCTFGSWHPLAAEKLLMLKYNSADEHTTFQRGILRINSKSFTC